MRRLEEELSITCTTTGRFGADASIIRIEVERMENHLLMKVAGKWIPVEEGKCHATDRIFNLDDGRCARVKAEADIDKDGMCNDYVKVRVNDGRRRPQSVSR